MIGALLDHLWQSTLFLCVAGGLTLALRRNGARARYWLWFAASMKFLVPVAALTAMLPRPAVSSASSLPLLPLSALAARISAPFAPRAQTAGGASAHLDAAPAMHWSMVLLVIWALGCAAVLLSWLLRWRQMRRVLAAARPLPLAAPIPIIECQAALEPSLVGIRRPVVMLPRGLAQRLSEAEIRAVLEHELAHYRRRDNLTAAMHMVVQALFWFYPPVWWLGARLVAEREQACDEAVLAAGTCAEVYAEGILKVCRFFAQPGGACAAGASGADLKRRMEAIMSGCNAFPVSPTKKVAVSIALAGALSASILFAAPVVPTAQAQASSAMNLTPAEHARLLAQQTRPQKEVPFNPSDFDKYVGYYELTSTSFFHVFRRGDRYFAQLTGQPAVEQYPKSPTEFFATVVPAQISFVSNSAGKVSGLVLHQNGNLMPAQRVAKSVALAAEAALQVRIRQNIASPGTAAAIRSQLESFERTGHALYSQMSPALAAATRQQAAQSAALFKRLGAFESLRLFKVMPTGADDYLATFAHGRVEVFIVPLASDGKVTGIFFHPIP